MKVAIATPAYWPEVRRGGERMAHDLAGALTARGHAVRIVTAHDGRPARTTEDGVEVVRAWRPPSGRLRRRGFEDHLTHLPFTFAELRRGGDDVVHALYHGEAAAALRAGRPTVWTYLGVPHRRGLANRRGRLALVQHALASDAVCVLSQAAAREFRRWLGVDPHVVPPGVDTAWFTPAGAKADGLRIICPAELGAPHKRPELLLAAFALVRRDRPGAQLLVQAGGPRADGIVHVDFDRPETLRDAYRGASVAALSSTGEAFGLVLAEALACGTPAVASDDGAGPEVIGDAGATFAGDDPRALADAILEAAAVDPATCRAQAERFSLERSADAHEAVYRHARAAAELRQAA